MNGSRPPTGISRWSLGDPMDLRPPPSPVPWAKVGLTLLTLAFLAVPLVGARSPFVQTFALVFLSIVLESLPFMLVGSLVGGLIEVFVSRERLAACLPRRAWAATCVAAGLGLVLPVCECAVVPVVRRLTRKGMPVSAAVAYLLGGPIVNPIVAASTLLAYKFDWTVVAARTAAGYAIAVSVGLAMGRLFRQRPALLETHPEPFPASCGHAHAHQDACECGHDHGGHSSGRSLSRRLLAALRHASDDFLAVAHFLIIGAAIAALAQTALERRTVLDFASLPLVPLLAMMLLAILLNLCSEADAFIAASFRGLMPLPAQLAFMLTGPMFDLKLLLMYRTLFTRRAIFALSILILLAVGTAAALFELREALS